MLVLLAVEVKYSGTVRAVWKSCPAWASLRNSSVGWLGFATEDPEVVERELDLSSCNLRASNAGLVRAGPIYNISTAQRYKATLFFSHLTPPQSNESSDVSVDISTKLALELAHAIPGRPMPLPYASPQAAS